MDFEPIAGASALIIVIALVELAKRLGFKKKYSPLLAVGLGIILSIAYTFYSGSEIYQAIILGVIVGLSAIGFYSGSKNVKEEITGD